MTDDYAQGTVLAGKYQVVRELGRGGMGVVLAADHLQLQQTVAIKLMKAGAGGVALERFKREARLVARLQSHHVCRVLDVGALDSGEPFIVMEMLEGGDLGQVLDERGAFTPQQVADYVLQALDAIGEAHLLGVVHRDLKPGNLFLTKGVDGAPFVKVLDFGISKAASQDDGLTATGEILGSPRFMAPEQMRKAKDVDTRADIWAIGAVMYELLTDRAAFEAETVAELLVLILQEDPEPLSRLRPELPPGLVAVVERCLQKDAEDRFANVAELAMALEPFASSRHQPVVQKLTTAFQATGWQPPPPGAGAANTAFLGSPGTQAMPAVAPVSGPATHPQAAPAASAGMPASGQPAASPHPPATPHRASFTPAGLSRPPDPHGPTLAGPPTSQNAWNAAGPAPGAPAYAPPAPQPTSKAPFIAIALAALMIALVGGGAATYFLLRSDDDGSTSSSSRSGKSSSKKSSDDGDTPAASSGGFPANGDAVYAGAATFVKDAVTRNKGHDTFVFVNIYRSGHVAVALQAHDKATRVMRWEYQNGEMWREMNYTKHATKPVAKTLFKGVDFAVVGKVQKDAMKRSAKVAGPDRKVFMIGLDKRNGTPTFHAMIEGGDADASYLYDKRGRFLRKN